MNWSAILSALPSVQKIISEFIASFKVTTAPVDPTKPPVQPAPGDGANLLGKPSEVIKALQTLLNQLLKLNPPLNLDGWLGPKTEAAIGDAIVKLRPYLSFLG